MTRTRKSSGAWMFVGMTAVWSEVAWSRRAWVAAFVFTVCLIVAFSCALYFDDEATP